MPRRPKQDNRERTSFLYQGKPKTPPTLKLVKELWRMKGVSIYALVAAIYETETGLELRILGGGEILETRLSREGEQPLLEHAERIRAKLLNEGWHELKRTS